MQKLNFWTIRPGDTELARKVQTSFNKLYQERPAGYRFALSDKGTSFSPAAGEINFIAGYDLDNLLGCARCSFKGPKPDIGAISMLGGLHSDTLSDYERLPVSRQNLARYDGYSGYQGIGPLLNIGILDMFRHRFGFGSQLLNYIKSYWFELIELEANGKGPARFFGKNGFVDTGIDAEYGEQLVMVWKNPVYDLILIKPAFHELNNEIR
jgi:hypothetical protein